MHGFKYASITLSIGNCHRFIIGRIFLFVCNIWYVYVRCAEQMLETFLSRGFL